MALIRGFWDEVPMPEHVPDDVRITADADAPSIQELFVRAAKGESLGGSLGDYDDDDLNDNNYDESMYGGDASLGDILADPDTNDKLYRESVILDASERVKDVVRGSSREKKKTKIDSKREQTASERHEDSEERVDKGESEAKDSK